MSRRDRQFSSVRTEGGLLPQDVLSRIQAGDKDLPGLTPADYHLGAHERIGEAVNRAWSRLTATWHAFQEALSKEPDSSLATGLTRDRWLLPLFEELRYGRLPKAQAIEVEGKSFAVSHTWHRSPIHLLGANVDLDRRQAGVVGAAKASPHGLVQELLNRSEEHLWGFVSNGLQLRILRDHHSLTRQAYVEFDLQAIMEGEQYSEFLLLWMVCHQSRVEADKPDDCWLETWFRTSRTEGVRALDKLRGGVEEAIESFGTGFLANRANKRLREGLESGELDKQEYYRQLLRLVYRVIFLFVAEERDALLDPDADDAAKNRYSRFYATRRLRELADKRRGGPHGDLWQGMRLVMSKLDDGCPELALPALGSRLWGPTACPWLMDAECANEHLLEAIRRISTIEEGRTRYSVNWRNVGADELGSIYEGLLELHPRMNKEAGTFELDTAPGHERKTTGSYYTPTELVDCLLESALDPVLDEASRKPDAEAAILNLKVCDPACGSGHFLVAAARRIAKRLAAVRAGEDEPSPREVQRALRDVVGSCIFGVDLNPMAVELCKVSLWMEAIEPGRPLSFLDSHIQCGNALLGATPALMSRGIPEEAFNAIEGDDPKAASVLRKRNRDERKALESGQSTMFALFEGPTERDLATIAGRARTIDGASDEDIRALRAKEASWDGLTRSAEFKDAWFRADAWCAAFVWPKQTDEQIAGAVTEDLWRRIQRDASAAPPVVRRTVRELARAHRYLHWHLAFPQVFGGLTGASGPTDTTGWSGGFDVVLGNPPWERIKLQEKEFFAARAPDVAGAVNAAARKRAIARLEVEDPELWAEWRSELRRAAGESSLVRDSGRYPLCGRGDINTYSIFAELNRSLLSAVGRAGFIVPSGIATDATTQHFFRELMEADHLRSLYDFQSGPGLFAEIGHARFKFCLLTLGRAEQGAGADFAFFLRDVAHLKDLGRRFTLTGGDISLLNPNTGTCPVFRTRRDAEITKHIYRRMPVLVREATEERPEENPWAMSFKRMLDMANDSGLFRTREDLENAGWRLRGNVFERDGERMLRLYEAKMMHHFDHRFGDYADKPPESQSTALPTVSSERLADPAYCTTPRYWVAESEVEARLEGRWDRGWLLGWRDICRSTDFRTVIAGVVPRSAVNDKFLLMFSEKPGAGVLASCLQSFAFDYVARQKLGGTSLKYFTMRQLPTIPPDRLAEQCPWSPSDRTADWLRPRVLELAFTAWDLAPFAHDLGYDAPPFRWDDDRRFLLRCELDAAFFHLYLGSRTEWHDTGSRQLLDSFPDPRDAVDYVLDTFHIVKRKDVAEWGDYRTKLRVLDMYDRMQGAIEAGQPYETPLDPAPADPILAHDERTRPQWMRPSAPAKVIPFRRPAPETPPWGPDILPAVAKRFGADGAGAWGSDISGDDLLRYALAAVLRALPEPWPSLDVQRAVIAVVWPNTLASLLDGDTQGEFRRLVGAADLSRPEEAVGNWHHQVRLAISHKLMRIENERWAAGPYVADATDDALAARAAVTVAWMLSEHRNDVVFEPMEALLA